MKRIIILFTMILMAMTSGAWAEYEPCTQPGCDSHDGDFIFNDGLTVIGDTTIKNSDLVFDMVEGPLNATGLMGIVQSCTGCVDSSETGGTIADSTTYCYNMTYVTADGETAVINRTDTSASNPTSDVTDDPGQSNDSSFILSSIPVSSDSRVLSKNIYRAECAGATNGNVLLNLIANISNATTGYVDTGDTETTGISMHNTTGAQIWMIDGSTLMMEASGKLTSFGLRAGQNNAGIDNTYFGWRAGEGEGSSASYGKANAGFGDGSLMQITSGQTNTALGHSSLRTLTTGSGNNCSGSHSCDILVSGSNNSIYGTSAFGLSVDGNNNTIIGSSAGLGFETAVANVVTGFEACKTAANCGGVDAEDIYFVDNNDTDDPLIGGDFGANILQIGGKVTQKMNFFARTGAQTLTAAQFLQYGINHTANGDALTLPTVTDLVAELTFCQDGSTGHQLIVRSIGSGTSTLTVDGSAEWTLSGTDFAVEAGNTAIFIATIDNCTTEAGTIVKISEQVH